MTRVACTCAMNFRRQQGRRARRERTFAANQPSVHMDPIHSQDDDLREALGCEVDRLPARYRLPLTLHFYGGLGFDQLASELRCTPGNARVMVHRAIERLRRRMAGNRAAMSATMISGALGDHGAAAEAAMSPRQATTLRELLSSPRSAALGYHRIAGDLSLMSKLSIAAVAVATLTAVPFVLSQAGEAPAPPAPTASDAPPADPFAEVGIVSGITVVSDKVPDMSNLAAWQAAYIRPGMSDEDKAKAIWQTVWTYQYQDGSVPLEYLHEEGVWDPIKTFNVYGYNMCGMATSHTEALARHVGLRARGRSIANHIVSEVFWNDAWHLMDGSLICYFPKPDGAIASVDEIVAGVSSWLDQHPELKKDDAKLRAFSRSPGWRTGPEILRRCPKYDERSNLPAFSHGWWATMQEYDGSKSEHWDPGYSQGYQVNIQLRKGERLVRNWSNKGLHINMDRPGDAGPGCLTMPIDDLRMKYLRDVGDLTNGRVGNGTLVYDVPLADGSFRAGAWSIDNIAVRPAGGSGPAVRAQEASLPAAIVLRMPTSYVYLSGACALTATVATGGSIVVAVSTNNGLDWTEAATMTESGTKAIDLKPLAYRRYDYRIRFTITGAGTGLESLRLTHDIQHSQRPLPALAAGDNTVTFGAGGEGTITLEGTTDLDLKSKQLTYLDFHPTASNIAPPMLSITGSNGAITFPVAVPGDLKRLRFGSYYRARADKGGWDYQVSFDGGRTFRTVDRAPGPTAWNCKYVTVSDIPAGTREALVRFSGETAGNAALIFGFRIDADYSEPHGGFRPVQVTYDWSEGGTPKRDVHVATKPGESWSIRCGSKPVMGSIALELAP
jgi:hypothetical protein